MPMGGDTSSHAAQTAAHRENLDEEDSLAGRKGFEPSVPPEISKSARSTAEHLEKHANQRAYGLCALGTCTRDWR